MTGPQIDNRVSLGNLLVVAGMIVSVAVAWGNLSSRSEAMKTQIAQNKAEISASEARLRDVENSAARQDERLILILDAVRKIETKIEGPER
jgi:hypothetical protein